MELEQLRQRVIAQDRIIDELTESVINKDRLIDTLLSLNKGLHDALSLTRSMIDD